MHEILTVLARQRQAELDAAIAAWHQAEGARTRLWCGPGCGNCCTLAVNATLPEALAIAAALSAGVREQLADFVARLRTHAGGAADARAFLAGYRQSVGACPFLDATQNCGIYAVRPLACRALLATRPPDWCGVNLAELPELERQAFLAGLDRTVVAFPTHYAAAPQQLAAAGERTLLLATVRHLGCAVSGNLPLIVWLCGRADFGAALDSGAVALPPLLTRLGVDRPFLMQIDTP
jgi:Fe-S-cluster containining protein